MTTREERLEKFRAAWIEHKDVDTAVEDVNEILTDGEFKARAVETVEEDSGRWYEHILEIVELDEDYFVGVRWDSGLTEMQENMYEDDDVYAVESRQVVTTEWYSGERL